MLMESRLIACGSFGLSRGSLLTRLNRKRPLWWVGRGVYLARVDVMQVHRLQHGAHAHSLRPLERHLALERERQRAHLLGALQSREPLGLRGQR
jgi:glycerol-3-phosphate O-acyltransferase